MASACVNNLPEPFLPWLPTTSPDPDDFEFPLDPPATMLPADQLFSDGKLLPLHLKPPTPKSPSYTAAAITTTTSTSTTDPYLFSPKAPRCSSRWKDLLGLKKLYPTTTTSKTQPSTKSLKNLLHHRTTPKSTSENAPLLSDSESLSLSSRLSLSSSSSSHDHDDLPRLSLDSEKPNPNPNISIHRNPNPNHTSNPNPNPNPRIRLVKPRAASFDSNKSQSDLPARPGRSPIRRDSDAVVSRGVSVDSPRMNSSGKIVFQSLERSSSSPSTFNGGPRFKHRGMERSYSANVRVTPVLNVPVCSLKTGSVFGFGQLFSSPQKRENKGHQSGRTRN
ncbi:uncharacterized protein LOC109813609 [Cajanus cajan]|nr:uncharacterized protein LOC109813609 [Cajanus cajan]